MDLFIGPLLEWLQEAIEKRWGKVWAWTVYSALILLFFGGVIWFLKHR